MRRRRKRQRKRVPKAAAVAKALPVVGPAKLVHRAPPLLRGPILYVAVALSAIFCTGMVDAAPARRATLALASSVPAPEVDEEIKPAPPLPIAWGAALPTVTVRNNNTGAHADLRLYSDHGSLEMDALHEFMRIAATSPDLPDKENGDVAEPLDPRLVQIAFRAAYHFEGASMSIISATRKGATGKHGNGSALDFSLEGVSANDLAAYARRYPRAGIGFYTHPKTQYVHVDVREHSYHWVDASPPGVTWTEQLLDDPTQQERDDGYVGSMDLPETFPQ